MAGVGAGVVVVVVSAARMVGVDVVGGVSGVVGAAASASSGGAAGGVRGRRGGRGGRLRCPDGRGRRCRGGLGRRGGRRNRFLGGRALLAGGSVDRDRRPGAGVAPPTHP